MEKIKKINTEFLNNPLSALWKVALVGFLVALITSLFSIDVAGIVFAVFIWSAFAVSITYWVVGIVKFRKEKKLKEIEEHIDSLSDKEDIDKT